MSYTSTAAKLLRFAAALLVGILALVSFATVARAQVVDLTPPSGVLHDPGEILYWNTKAYDVTFSSPANISALEWKINLSVTQTISARIYNASKVLVASGTPVPGTGAQAFVRAPITFTPAVGTHYWVALYCSDTNAIFPRKESPTYPFTTGNVTVYGHQSTSGDASPNDINSWAPFIRIVENTNLAIVPGIFNFGNQRVGTTSGNQTFTITNTGSASISITSFTKAGPFNVVGLNPVVLAPSGQTTFDANFAPVTIGAASGSVTINNDDPGGPRTITFSGNGTTGILSLNPSTVNFATVQVGTMSNPTTITITNTGLSTLNIIDSSVTGPFAVSGLSAAALAPAASTTFTVRFAPTATGPVSGNVKITSDAPSSPATLTLNGTGAGPAIGLSSTNVAFASQRVGTTSGRQLVTISNSGTGPLTVTNVTLGGANGTDFGTVLPVLPTTLAPMESTVIGLTFTPTTTGMRSASATVQSNDPSKPAATVTLGGTGISPAVAFAPTGLDFGDVEVTTTKSLSVLVTNTGDDKLTIKSVQTTGSTRFSLLMPPSLPVSLPAGGTLTLNVAYAPTAVAVDTGVLALATDLPASPNLTVPLSGRGLSGILSVAPFQIDFAGLAVGATSAASDVVITNTGVSPFSITGASVTGATPQQFPLTLPALPARLTPLAMATLTVAFAPNAPMPFAGKLHILSDIPGGVPVDVDLTGLGLQGGISVSPTSLDFGIVPVGAASAPSTLTVRNTGTSSVTLAATTVIGSSASEFIVRPSPFSMTLSGGQSATLDVTFTPSMAGPAQAVLRINSAGTGNVDVPLAGQAIVLPGGPADSDAGAGNGVTNDLGVPGRGGCGCRTGAAGKTSHFAIACAGFALLLARRSRRRGFARTIG